MKKYEFPADFKVRFHVRKPAEGRTNWSIRKLTLSGENGLQKKWSTLSLNSVDALNEAFAQGALTPERMHDELTKVIEGLYKKEGVKITQLVSNEANRGILNKFWEDEYGHREVVDRESMYSDYRRAVEAVGEVSLAGGTEKELLRAIKHLDQTKRRRVTQRLNSILKWLGREFTLKAPKPTRPQVTYLTPEQFAKVVQHLAPDFRLMCEMAFYSGCRQGELFDLNDFSLVGSKLRILGQVDIEGEQRETKTRQERSAYLFPQGVKLFRQWVEAKDRVTTGERAHASRTLKAACIKAKVPPVTFHALRHSYAIRCLMERLTVKQVAQWLGNSVSVCERYYAGFVMVDEEFDAIAEALNERLSQAETK